MIHAAYLDAVADALEAAGIPVADRRADPGPPRDGWIPFDLARQHLATGRLTWDHDTAGLAWSETGGWRLLTVDAVHGRREQALPLAVVAAPAAVARAVAALAGRAADEPGYDAPPAPATTVDEALEQYVRRLS